MRKRRRWIILIVLLLVGGMVVNVGVAWGCVLWSGPRLHGMFNIDAFVPAELEEPPFAHWPTDGAYATKRASGFRVRMWTSETVSANDRVSPLYQLGEYSAGWPFLALSSISAREWNENGNYKIRTSDLLRLKRGFEPPDFLKSDLARKRRRLLPAYPLWSGFAINTLFYTLVLMLPLVGFAEVRRFRQARRGACAQCGYDLSATPADMPCPECGAGDAAPETRSVSRRWGTNREPSSVSQ